MSRKQTILGTFAPGINMQLVLYPDSIWIILNIYALHEMVAET